MAKYVITGAAGAASATAATAGIIKVENATPMLSVPKIYEWSIGPGAVAEDSNYTIQLKRQSTAGTWTGVTPNPTDTSWAASKAVGGRASTAAGTAGVSLGTWGFNQRGGFRYVCVPGGEFVVNRADAHGIIMEYVVVAGTAVNYATMYFEE